MEKQTWKDRVETMRANDLKPHERERCVYRVVHRCREKLVQTAPRMTFLLRRGQLQSEEGLCVLSLADQQSAFPTSILVMQ